jgi:hypothetical protein
MDSDRERRVRERAYAIWEREGRPQGREAEHWLEAEREIAAETEIADVSGNVDQSRPEVAPAPRPRRSRAVPKGEPRRKAEAP